MQAKSLKVWNFPGCSWRDSAQETVFRDCCKGRHVMLLCSCWYMKPRNRHWRMDDRFSGGLLLSLTAVTERYSGSYRQKTLWIFKVPMDIKETLSQRTKEEADEHHVSKQVRNFIEDFFFQIQIVDNLFVLDEAIRFVVTLQLELWTTSFCLNPFSLNNFSGSVDSGLIIISLTANTHL